MKKTGYIQCILEFEYDEEIPYEKGGSGYDFHITARSWVNNAPTIIPADPAEEGER